MGLTVTTRYLIDNALRCEEAAAGSRSRSTGEHISVSCWCNGDGVSVSSVGNGMCSDDEDTCVCRGEATVVSTSLLGTAVG